jgi:hypothetical protein
MSILVYHIILRAFYIMVTYQNRMCNFQTHFIHFLFSLSEYRPEVVLLYRIYSHIKMKIYNDSL